MIITNAFSLNMLETSALPTHIEVTEISRERAIDLLAAAEENTSAVGHADTAKLLSDALGVAIPMNRATLAIKGGDLLVGQYSGPRLPEGTSVLPEGARIKWLHVRVSAFTTDLRRINGG